MSEDLLLSIQTVGTEIQCVAIGSHRIAGGKPYPFGRGTWKDMTVNRGSLLASLPGEWKAAIYLKTGEMGRGYSEDAPVYKAARAESD